MNNFYTNVVHMGNAIKFRGIENGKRIKKSLNYKPTVYTQAKKETKWKTLEGKSLEKLTFDSINDFKEFKASYKDVENFKLYGEFRHDYGFISDAYPEDIVPDFKQVRIAFLDIEVGSENGFPEPSKASEPITAITLEINDVYYVFGCGDYTVHDDNVEYYKCDNEVELIRKFVEVWRYDYPDIVTGWSTNQFDWPYIINRMDRLFLGSSGEDLTKHLSPWAWIKERNVDMGRGADTQFYDIVGIAMIDYLDLYKKYGSASSHESYKLDYIASIEVGEKKIDYSEFTGLYDLYKKDYQKFIDYNIHDVRLVKKIEAKTRLLELAMTLAYDSKVNYEDIFSQVRMWDVIIYNHLKHKNVILPPKKDVHKKQQFEGAYVKDPKPGLHKWVASFDFQSLYPHLIMMYNLSPETLIEPVDYNDELDAWFDENRTKISVEGMLTQQVDTDILKRMNLTLTPNGQVFDTSKHGFLPELMEKMYEDRARYKKLMTDAKRKLETATTPEEKEALEATISRYNNLQSTKKVCLNSAYGAIGNQYFRFFDVRIAEAVTLSAQLSVIWIQRKLNAFINKYTGATKGDHIIASDTDSVYVTFNTIVDKAYTQAQRDKMGTVGMIKAIDQLCEKIVGPQIDKYCQELADYVNAYDQKLIMKREALADKMIILKKKHYMINIHNNEGVQYAKPKLKIVGMAAIKSSTPGICRKKVKEAFEIIINSDVQTLRTFADDFRKEFMGLPVQDVASPLGMKGLTDYDGGQAIYKSKTPAHVKGALIYNHWLKKLNLTTKYQSIKEGEKLKYVYLKEPNSIQSPIISFQTVLPNEFKLDKYIDYPLMFEKTFLSHIEKVTEVIGWKLEEVSSLEGLFG